MNRRKKWKVKNYKRETFENLIIVTTKIYEEVINPTLHSGSRELVTKGFGTSSLADIL